MIVPPITTFKGPLMGVHILHALAVEMGYKTDILYLNVLLTPEIGAERFDYLSYRPFEIFYSMFNERLFARSAHGLPPMGKTPEACTDELSSVSGGGDHQTMFHTSADFDLEAFLEMESICYDFLQAAIPVIASLDYKIVGCTQREGQTNCSTALLKGIKALRPGIVTITGGSNCKGELAEGIASLSDAVDYIFEGESESAFVSFLENYSAGQLPSRRIIPGEFVKDLDTLPMPDYTPFIEQTKKFRGEDALKKTSLIYETSRGCWWSARKGCRFCSEDIPFRQKKPGESAAAFKELCRRYRPEGIYMSDISMPLSYNKEVFPALMEEEKRPVVYYQARTDLTPSDLLRLKEARIEQFTVGIEALSSGLLELMNKGVTPRQNLNFLRYARSIGLYADWLLLWGFPGDKIGYYRETLELLPLIRHLQPPAAMVHHFLTRFSPYFKNPAEYGITNIRPWAVYDMIFPQWADKDKLATWFTGDYPCEAHENPGVMKAIAEEIRTWKEKWQTTRLVMIPFQDCYLVIDNRGIDGKRQLVLEYGRAKEIMTAAIYNESEHQQWAVEEKLAILDGSWFVPLVTASPGLLIRFEE